MNLSEDLMIYFYLKIKQQKRWNKRNTDRTTSQSYLKILQNLTKVHTKNKSLNSL